MLDNNKHRTAMYRLLTGMFRDSYLSALLGFKGGTACYFFYDLPRFSVDLDFDIVTRNDDTAIYEKIQEHVTKVIKDEGFTVRDRSLKKNTIFFHVSYEDKEHNIKIEISHRDYPNTYEVKDFYGLGMNVLSRKDIFAHKLVAATDRKRTAMRDFFDIWFFLKEGWPINEDIIKIRTGKDLKSYFIHLKAFVDKNVTARNILHGLGEVLDEKEKNWVKLKLKEELTRLMDFYIDKQIT